MELNKIKWYKYKIEQLEEEVDWLKEEINNGDRTIIELFLFLCLFLLVIIIEFFIILW